MQTKITMEKSDITTIADVRILVDSFYAKVREDDQLADIFNNVIKELWIEHLEKMYRFWQTVLLEEHTYFGSPFVHHVNLPVDKTHFERWLKLFEETIDEYFSGTNAESAKLRAEKMAEMFLHKIEYYRSNPSKSVL